MLNLFLHPLIENEDSLRPTLLTPSVIRLRYETQYMQYLFDHMLAYRTNHPTALPRDLETEEQSVEMIWESGVSFICKLGEGTIHACRELARYKEQSDREMDTLQLHIIEGRPKIGPVWMAQFDEVRAIRAALTSPYGAIHICPCLDHSRRMIQIITDLFISDHDLDKKTVYMRNTKSTTDHSLTYDVLFDRNGRPQIGFRRRKLSSDNKEIELEFVPLSRNSSITTG